MAKIPNTYPRAASLGKIRRSQLISSYAIGSIIDLEKGSFMPMGLEGWESSTNLPSLKINEQRLQSQLGVNHFRLPPITEEANDRGMVNPTHAIPAIRFPEWHECPICHRIGKSDYPFQLSTDGNQLECVAHRRPARTSPVRLIIACREGHIDEFPWEWWAHRNTSRICDNSVLELRSLGRSAALSDLYVHCQSCNSSESLGGAFIQENFKNFRCHGRRPWLGDNVQDCQQAIRVIQRGASNVHFAVVLSALSIPPASESAFQIIDQYWPVISALPPEALPAALEGLVNLNNIPAEVLNAAYRERKRFDKQQPETTDTDLRIEEYAALSEDKKDPILGGVVPHFRNSVSLPPPEIAAWFDLVGAASRLREVRVLAGFNRIEPYPVSSEKITQAIHDRFVSPLSRSPKNWLPAAEIRGEGIFLRFSTRAIDDWINTNPRLQRRADALEKRSQMLAAERGYTRDYEITPRLLLVHSFAHALIRTISINCGYSSSALRERLYVKEKNERGEAMNGVLIYTGSPDSEGSLGGLVRLAEPSQIGQIVKQAIQSAQWCGSDPVCIETDPLQSGDRIAGASCHCCLLLPETACEKFNRELDRSVMIGLQDTENNEEWTGFFSSEIE